MIPASDVFDQSIIAALLDHDPVVQDYRAFFSFFNWSLVDEWQARRSPRGRPPVHPESAYIKAFLIRVRESLLYSTNLRDFLLKHPLLIIELGFELVLDPHAPYGFHTEKTLPCRYWLSAKLRTLDHTLLQDLLQATVAALQAEIPGLGETVAFDVKHIYAWVKQNNPRVYDEVPWQKDMVLKGDPDCKLGVKRSTNKTQADGTIKKEKERLWGYGTGVAAATVADYGDIVLAEDTQPFNAADVTYFLPLSVYFVCFCFLVYSININLVNHIA